MRSRSRRADSRKRRRTARSRSACYVEAAAVARVLAAFPARGRRSRRTRLGGPVALVPPPGARRRPLDRAAVGTPRRRRAGCRDRPRPSLRHGRASDDAPLRRAARPDGARLTPRRRLRLGRALDRGRQARLRARARGRQRPGRDRDDAGERRPQRRRDRGGGAGRRGRRPPDRGRRGRERAARAGGGRSCLVSQCQSRSRRATSRAISPRRRVGRIATAPKPTVGQPTSSSDGRGRPGASAALTTFHRK